MNKDALKKLEIVYLTDPAIQLILAQLGGIYSRSIPIGLNENGMIYNKITTALIDELKRQLNEYTQSKYSDLFNKLDNPNP